MSSRQIVQGLFLAAGLAILVLSIMPAVHLPFVVLHGPMTALHAQRAAWLLEFLIRAAAFLLAGLLTPLLSLRDMPAFGAPPLNGSSPLHLNCALRC